MNYRKIITTGLFLPLLFLFSCAPEKETVTPFLPGSLTKPVEQKSTREMEWEKAQKEAKKEQWLVIYSASSGETRQALTQAMKDKYGINVDWVTMMPPEVQAKVLAENRAGIKSVDIIIAGSTIGYTLKPHGIVEPLEKLLLLPEAKDPSKWYESKFPWWDNEHMIIIPLVNISPIIAINTESVEENEMRSYRDLLNPKWKGRISMTSPLIGGTGLASFGMLGEYILGWDYFKELAKQEPVILTDTRLGVEWLARGKQAIAFSARSESMIEFQKAGAPVKYMAMREGSYATDAGTGFIKLKDSPHRTASTVFINWLLTRDGQKVFSEARGFESNRIDVSKDHIDPIRIRVPGIKYYTQDEKARSLQNSWIAKAKEILGTLIH